MKETLIDYLNSILSEIENIKQKEVDFESNKDVYAKLANSLRLYYIGFNQILLTGILQESFVFKNNQTNEVIKHIENSGWVQDKDWQSDSYLPGLKANLILDVWSVISKETKSKEDEFIKNFKILVDSILNNSIVLEDFNFTDLEITNIKDENINIDNNQTLQLIRILTSKI